MPDTFAKIRGRYKNSRHFLTSLYQTLKYGYPAKDLTIIGVTGTDGKTTTSHLIYEILREAKYKVALISTVGAWGPKGFIDTGLHTTTPDATVLQPLLKKFKDEGVTHVVLEVTSHGLDQHRVFGCNFYAGVLTNVTHEHLDYHKTFSKYKNAKAKLFKGVKLAILNRDDESFEYFKGKAPKSAKVISYSVQKLADIRGTEVKSGLKGLSMKASDNGVAHPIKTTLVGDYNASNVLASVGITRTLGIDWKTIQKATEKFTDIPGRMEYIKVRPFSVIVDFAHTPNALKQLLSTLNARKGRGKVIAVFGCAGLRDSAKRPMMGEIAAKLADISIFTAEDPRTESLDKIIASMVKGARSAHAKEIGTEVARKSHPRGGLRFAPQDKHIFMREPDRGRAIELAISLAKKGDIVVICGKGHEKSMAFGKTEIPWSDQEEARKAIQNKSR